MHPVDTSTANYVLRNTLRIAVTGFSIEAISNAIFRQAMGRSGITYVQVADAAAQLLDEGCTPTVDAVRARIGAGSKTTLAPLLKRWKASSVELVASAQAGLPATLLQAIQTVYQGMQHDAQQQVAARDAEHVVEQAAAQQRSAELEVRCAELHASNVTLAKELEVTHTDLTQLQAEQRADALRLSDLTSDNHGLNARLTERAAQLAALTHHFDQNRQQFEHFQEAAARQRSEERQAAEQRLQLRDQALLSMQQQVAGLQASSAHLVEQTRLLHTDRERLEVALGSARDQAAALQAERDQLAFQFKEVDCARSDLAQRWEKSQVELEQIREQVRTALAERQQVVWVCKRELEVARARILALEAAPLEAAPPEAAPLKAALREATPKGPAPNPD